VDVVVAGGHGKVALRLLRLLAARGEHARGLIRDPSQAADLEAVGAEPVLADLERDEITEAVAGADAVVFAAGAGPGSGAARKRTVDYGGAVKLIEAARANGISRYLMVSAMGAGHPKLWPEGMDAYYEAKSEADRELAASGLEFTVVRPGYLTDQSGTGRIEAAPELNRRGKIPRDDVAATLVACLDEPGTIGKAFDVLAGEVPITEALRALEQGR
jgi:uncharacterized protein YbjT (DUF2867 family)